MSDVPVKYYNNAAKEIGLSKDKWWAVEEGERYNYVFAAVNKILDYQKYRDVQNIRYARLYHNMDLVSLRAGLFTRTVSTESGNNNRSFTRLSLNVVKSCIDTVASKIAKNKPRPMFLTANGNWGLQRKAKLLTKYLEGLFDHQGAYTEGQKCFIDSTALDLGCMKVYPDTDRAQICFERVQPGEIIVDDVEGRYGNPRELFQAKLIQREVLVTMFPKFKNKIMAAQSGLSAEEQKLCNADMVTVIEAWHLPSGSDSTDGVHTIVIENATLFDDTEYDKDYFPFAFLRWTQRLIGFYGISLTEEIVGIQLEINKILRNIAIAQHLMAVPQVWLESGSHVVSSHINNEFGGIKYYNGTMPVFQVPQAMSQEVYQHLWQLFQKAFEITGVSQMSASSVKPAGVTAAVAMREMTDIETERFMLTAQRYEQFYMDIARIAIDMTRDMYEDIPNIEIKVKDGKFMRQLKWKDVDIDEDMYSMRMFPTSLLPSQPAGKLQKVQELMQAGFLDKDESLSLLDFPDTDKAVGLKTAARENLLRIIDLMLDDGHYTSLEPYMNAQLGLQLTQNAYNEAETQNCPDDRLELLRRFMTECDQVLQPAQAAAVPLGATPDMAAGPQASPQAPPTSELLPFAGAGQPPGAQGAPPAA